MVPRRLGVPPSVLEPALGMAALELLRVELLVARDLDRATFELSALTTLTPTPWRPPLVA